MRKNQPKKIWKEGQGGSLRKEKSVTVDSVEEDAFPKGPTIKFHAPDNVRIIN
jgi:hypothetical protein